MCRRARLMYPLSVPIALDAPRPLTATLGTGTLVDRSGKLDPVSAGAPHLPTPGRLTTARYSGDRESPHLYIKTDRLATGNEENFRDIVCLRRLG